MPNAVDRCDITAVGDRVGTLNGFPSAVLIDTVLFFLRGMPANRRGIKKNFRALQRCQPRAFRIPLIPTNEYSDLAVARIPRAKALIARREIELLIKERIIRNVHFPVGS